ncbi:hypothetical protein D3C87_1890230 [compost metagenome]
MITGVLAGVPKRGSRSTCMMPAPLISGMYQSISTRWKGELISLRMASPPPSASSTAPIPSFLSPIMQMARA